MFERLRNKSKEQDQQGKKKKRRHRFYELSQKPDIRYRGPLSYRHFRIFGWLMIGLSQICVLLNLAGKVSPEIGEKLYGTLEFLSSVASLSLPLLLLASFAVILDTSQGYKTQLLSKGLAAGIVIVLFEFIFYRYIVGAAGVFVGGREAGQEVLYSALEGSSSGFLAFNIFIDLVLCILFMFFLNYRPHRFFTGKKLIIFRLFAILPILYELASLLLKYGAISGMLKIVPALYPFLTTKPPIMFLVFIILAAYIKTREKRFCKQGGTHKEYQAFLLTNRNSWSFSVFTAIIMVIAGVVDALIVLGMAIFHLRNNFVTSANYTELVYEAVSNASELGFGNSIMLIPLAPVILLFSYTRKYKNVLVDLLIPLLGVVLIVFIYLEAIYHSLGMLSQFALGG